MTVDDEIRVGRWAAQVDGDFVVFIIGAALAPAQDFAEAIEDYSGGMLPMLDYLVSHPERGLLGYHAPTPFLTIQYCRSFDHLEAFARNTDDPHLAAWRTYRQRVTDGERSGIFHETFLVRAGEYESVYVNIAPIGLGAATDLVRLEPGSTARRRFSGERNDHPTGTHPGDPAAERR